MRLRSAARRALAVVACWLLLGSAAAATVGGINPDDILPPEQAFPVELVTGSNASPATIALRWNIAPGYYLYKSRFRFSTRRDSLRVDPVRFPRGKLKDDEFLGRQEIFRGRLTVPLHIAYDGGGEATLIVTSQGCADIGICFPPTERQFNLPGATFLDARLRSNKSASADPLNAAPGPALFTSPAVTAGPSSAAPRSSTGASDNIGALLTKSTGDDAAFLPLDEAFAPTANLLDAHTLRVRWAIAPEHYLYRKKLQFTLTMADAPIRVAGVTLPQGEIVTDDYFGQVETYRGILIAVVDLAAAINTPVPLRLAVTYQGCADAGLCYPPTTKRFELLSSQFGDEQLALADELPSSVLGADAIDPPVAGSSTDGASLSEQDRVARTLRESNVWLVIVTFYAFGLLLSLTPCVLPMVPILSSILAGESARSRGYMFGLSAFYVGAMAITYALVGVLAGLTGANLQIIFQHPAVLVAFSAVFVALAASMFGFFELQLPTSWQSRLTAVSARQTRGSLVGAGVMGVLSALIVGPCVAAPLAGALVYISQTGDAMLGGIALLCLGFGMGTPLLAIGASAGSLLPRIGPWMEAVKRVFGFVLLGVAVYLLERILPGWATLLLWSLLMIVAAVQVGVIDALDATATGLRRVRKGVGIALLLYGVLVLGGAITGGENVLRPLDPLLSGQQKKLQYRDVKGVSGLNAALADAAARGRPAMLDYYADWCVSCKELERYTFRDAAVQAVLADTVVLRTDVTHNDTHDQALLKRFDLFGPPAILFFGPDGRERTAFRVVGFMEAGAFSAHAARALGQVRLAASR